MLKRVFKIALILAVIAFIGIQFIRPERISPPVVSSENLFATGSVPPEVRAIMARSCNDCHSHQTTYPWYSNVAPVSWWMNNHIEDGRQDLNFNQWNTYSSKQKKNRLEAICEVVKAGRMPLPSYLWAHRDAVLTENDKALLCEWTKGGSSKAE